MMKILIIEDELNIRRELSQLLENALYDTETITEFTDIASQVKKCAPDLILLDVDLPGTDGFTVCTEIRSVCDIPIIFVTGLSGSMDELNGILKGGDDYITKPYQPPLLLARIAAVLKRARKNPDSQTLLLKHRGLTLDVLKSTVAAGEKSAELTKNELQILYYLFQHKEEIVPRPDLIEYLWDNQIFIDDNTLSVNVTRIRNKLRELGIDGFIDTKRGLGYRI